MFFSLRFECSIGAQLNVSCVFPRFIQTNLTFIGNETIINNKEVLKGEFSSKLALIFNLMIFSNISSNATIPMSLNYMIF